MIRCKPEKIHRNQVAILQERVKKRKGTLALRQGQDPSNTLRNSSFKKKSETVDLSKFNEILQLDLENNLLVVEPKMSIKRVMKLLLAQQRMLPVVPEFNSITIGGAIMGASIESSSHNFGQFNDVCQSYELILGDGSVVTASPTENNDLFYAIAGSYGTIAILTAVTIKLIETKRYVHLIYKRFWDYPNVVDHLRRPNRFDFVEGIIFSKSWGVTIEGSLTNHKKDLLLNKQGKFYKPWYYQHVLEKTKKGDHEELMPIRDYLFRFDQGAFWMGRFVGRISLLLRILFRIRLDTIGKALQERAKRLKVSEGPKLWFRALFAPFLSSKKLYQRWHQVPGKLAETLFFIQDFYTPISQTHSILNKCIASAEIYPIWLCPVKNSTGGQFLSPHYCDERMINIGLYGIPKVNVPIPLLTKKLEKELYESGGKKMLYSYTYYDEPLFSKIYDATSYEKVREKYGATGAFIPLYNKVTDNS